MPKPAGLLDGDFDKVKRTRVPAEPPTSKEVLEDSETSVATLSFDPDEFFAWIKRGTPQFRAYVRVHTDLLALANLAEEPEVRQTFTAALDALRRMFPDEDRRMVHGAPVSITEGG